MSIEIPSNMTTILKEKDRLLVLKGSKRREREEQILSMIVEHAHAEAVKAKESGNQQEYVERVTKLADLIANGRGVAELLRNGSDNS